MRHRIGAYGLWLTDQAASQHAALRISDECTTWVIRACKFGKCRYRVCGMCGKQLFVLADLVAYDT